MREYTPRPTFPEVEAKLEQMNDALRRYENARTRSEKNQADQEFSDCYDWFNATCIPFYFDETNHTWEFGVPRLNRAP